MTNRKNTKRALFASVISLLLCVTMLIGTTFAWFTDNASTSVNSIQSGTLKIGLYTDEACTKTAEGQTLSFTKGGDNVLWEPGATWTLPTVYIKNEGSLAVKYNVGISGIDGDAKLNEVIDWTISTGIATGETEGHLSAGETKAITISGTMQTTAGNDYQGLTIDGIGINVFATQDTVEYDSTTDQYDANASLPKVDNAMVVNDASYMKKAGNYILVAEDYSQTFGKNESIADGVQMDLGGTSQYVSDSIKAEAGQDITLANGTLVKTGSYGKARLDTKGQDQVALFENMNFVDKAAPSHTGSSSNDTADMIQIAPNGGGTGKYVFRNCSFNNANVEINGMGDGAPVEIVFENCTFNNTGNSGAIEINGNYLGSSKLTVKDCTFNLETTSNICAVSAMNQKNVSISFEGKNVVNGSVADANVYKLFNSTSVKVTNAVATGVDSVTVSGIATK